MFHSPEHKNCIAGIGWSKDDERCGEIGKIQIHDCS
jgi:hypothetical protein